MPAPPTATETAAQTSFVERFAEVRRRFGPLVLGVDPSDDLLGAWGLPVDADGLERFVDAALAAAEGRCGIVKPQSAFFERHGWRGVRALERLLEGARSLGMLNLLDVKRGDIGSTNDAYAAAYLDPAAPLHAEALTVSPYLGFDALEPFFARATSTGAGVFVVVRSSNDPGRAIQQATDALGRPVEQSLLSSLGQRNAQDGAQDGAIGLLGAVFAPNHGPPEGFDLRELRGLLLSPGIGAQGATVQDVARCFAACPERVLPSASRALLRCGPDPKRLGDAISSLASDVHEALG